MACGAGRVKGPPRTADVPSALCTPKVPSALFASAFGGPRILPAPYVSFPRKREPRLLCTRPRVKDRSSRLSPWLRCHSRVSGNPGFFAPAPVSFLCKQAPSSPLPPWEKTPWLLALFRLGRSGRLDPQKPERRSAQNRPTKREAPEPTDQTDWNIAHSVYKIESNCPEQSRTFMESRTTTESSIPAERRATAESSGVHFTERAATTEVGTF